MTTMYHKALRIRPKSLSSLSCLFHISSTSRHLVGLNDPISNLRPIIYTDTPTPPASHSQGRLESRVHHPYSLHEFADTEVSQDRTLELQFKLAREQLDAFNHNYWVDSNTRFETAKQAILSSIPESASPEMRENALGELYKGWVLQEKSRQEEYSAEWRQRNWDTIVLAARVEIQRFKQSILG